MYCNKCGVRLSDDSNFCEKCGTPVTNVKEENKVEAVASEKVIEEEKRIEIEEKQVTREIKIEKSDTSFLDEAVADLRPDDLDELIPKKNFSVVIAIVVVVVLIAVGVFIYFDLTTDDSAKKGKEKDYQSIINEYALSIESVASDYLLKHELINDFSEIKDLVKYDKHKVVCNNVYINIDGTVYLSECSVDGKEVEEVYGRKKSILTKEGEEVCSTNYNEENNELEFHFEKEVVSVFECESKECGLYETEYFKYNSCLDQIAVIQDGDLYYLYNYQAGQNVIDPMSDIAAIKKDNKYVGFIIQDAKTEKYGYVDTRGTVKLELEYDDLGIIHNGKLYDRGMNLDTKEIIAKKDGLYGVIDYTSGKEIIPFKYEQVYLGEDNKYVAKKDGKYYVINKDMEEVLDKSYDMIFVFKDVLVVNDDDKLKIVDYDGESIIDDEIDISVDYSESLESGVFGYNVVRENDNIVIQINDSNTTDMITKYIYNTKDKKLKKQS